MARKKRKPEKRKRSQQARPPDLSDLPDPRAMEGAMQQLFGGLQGGPAPDTPLAQAQALMYQAFAEPRERRRLQLVKQALEICPDCADAYVLLAEHAPRRKEALHLYEQGVRAGERALGPQMFQEEAGSFWGLLETRPYMRARLGLIHALWTTGRREEAVQHAQEMLRLNPNDNQGVRYTLAGFLLFLDRDEDLGRLLDQYPDEGSATWAYTRALLAFRRHGDSPEARQLLRKARKANRHVPAYVLGEKFPPAEQPSYTSPGDDSEALDYIGSFLVSWKATPGAVAWLRANVQAGKRRAPAPRPKGPLGFIKKWLKERLLQEEDVWQVGWVRLPTWIRGEGEPVRPWAVVVVTCPDGWVLSHPITEQPPEPALLWDGLVQAMQNPIVGQPHRPREIQVRPDEPWETLRPHFEEIGVLLTVREELDEVDAALRSLIEHVCGEPQPGLLEMPGITPERVGSFYDAAAGFFRQAPWKKVGYEAAIRVETDRFEGGPWYAVLMGQSGLTTGLALYEDLDLLRQLWAGDADDEENARRSVATSVTFEEASSIPVADVEAAERYGWPVARPDAYPCIFHKERGHSARRPLAWELELMEGCLRAVPAFVQRRGEDDPTPEEFTVPTASGPLQLVLGWVVEEES